MMFDTPKIKSSAVAALIAVAALFSRAPRAPHGCCGAVTI
jgi:hypothetical protein